MCSFNCAAIVLETIDALRTLNPRSLTAECYAEVYRSKGIHAEAASSIPDGVAKSVLLAQEADAPLIMLGSLYMYGDVKKALLAICS